MKEEKYWTRNDMVDSIVYIFRDKVEAMTEEELIVQLEYLSGGEESAVWNDGLFLLTEPMEEDDDDQENTCEPACTKEEL